MYNILGCSSHLRSLLVKVIIMSSPNICLKKLGTKSVDGERNSSLRLVIRVKSRNLAMKS